MGMGKRRSLIAKGGVDHSLGCIGCTDGCNGRLYMHENKSTLSFLFAISKAVLWSALVFIQSSNEVLYAY